VAIEHIGDLHPDRRNARKHNPRNIGMIAASLQEVGAARSIVIDEDNNILAGNGTIEAAAQAGIERVLVVDADGETVVAVRRTGLTPAQKTRLALFDNRTAELADWDTDVLSEMADSGDLAGLFYEDELADLLASVDTVEPGDGGDDFDTTPDDGPTRVQPGDVWRIGDHRLMCGDSTRAEDVARLMVGEPASAVVTDPPYGINREGITNDDPEGLRELFTGCLAAMPLDNGVCVAFQSTRLFPEWLDASRAAGHKFERMLWMYKPNDITFPWRGWILKSEAILVSTVGKATWQEIHPYAHDCYTANWDKANKVDIDGWHGSIKPFTVMGDLVPRVTAKGAVVYDPFLGSGTTLIAAHRTGRRCYGMEIEPKYCDVILRRAEAEGIGPIERVEGHGRT
jgi:DNA modification methylase